MALSVPAPLPEHEYVIHDREADCYYDALIAQHESDPTVPIQDILGGFSTQLDFSDMPGYFGGAGTFTAPTCEGDANGDGAVDPLDAGFVLARFGCPVGTGDPDCDAADQNGDGSVDPLDTGFVLARFGTCEAPPLASTGACSNGVCTEETQSDCEAAGGVYQGHGTSCESDPAPGACDAVNAGGCTPAANTVQVGILGGFSHMCGGPNDEWVSLAYPIYDTHAGDIIHAINITHNTNTDVGTLYLMGDADCPDITNMLWTGDSVIQGNGTGENTRYCIADADGNPITSPGGTVWVVAAPHSSFAFDIAFDCTDAGASGRGFAQLGGDGTDCGTWLDLNLFLHGLGDPCASCGTFGGCALVSVEIGDACDPCDAVNDACSAGGSWPPESDVQPDVEPAGLSIGVD
ncbi:MAG: hypothetical protein IH988_09850 [Planctomycetes bacterium]|nr:hypothetical protein [Planctomycetota bacterium]